MLYTVWPKVSGQLRITLSTKLEAYNGIGRLSIKISLQGA